MTKVVTCIKVEEEILKDFYIMLIKLFGRTRGYISNSMTEALEMWMKAKEQELEN